MRKSKTVPHIYFHVAGLVVGLQNCCQTMAKYSQVFQMYYSPFGSKWKSHSFQISSRFLLILLQKDSCEQFCRLKWIDFSFFFFSVLSVRTNNVRSKTQSCLFGLRKTAHFPSWSGGISRRNLKKTGHINSANTGAAPFA